jgi:hypothetical protein
MQIQPQQNIDFGYSLSYGAENGHFDPHPAFPYNRPEYADSGWFPANAD